jgi:hypothetical protein
MKIALQAAAAAVGLVAYLAVCWAYRKKWDAAIRASLSRRLGVEVRWHWVSNSGMRPAWSWHSDADGPLGRTVWHTIVIGVTQYATAAVLGVLPALALIWVEIEAGFSALVVVASAFLVIPIASVFFLRRGPVAVRQ